MRSREPKRLPAMTRASSMTDAVLRPSAHEGHHLQGVTVAQADLRVLALAKDLAIHLHRHPAANSQLGDQGGEGEAVRHLATLAVDRQGHLPGSARAAVTCGSPR